MAAATVAAGFPRVLATGHMREWLYALTNVADTNTLDTPLHSVKAISTNPATKVTYATVASQGSAPAKQRITFAVTSGPEVGTTYVRVMGW